MGVYVTLYLDPAGIDSAAWERCFEETLSLLRAHPSPLMGYDTADILGVELPVYTREIERDRGGPEWRWSVCGDLETLRRAESFELRRDLGAYPRPDRLPPSEDILWSAHDTEYLEGPVRAFGEKTQGEPYHFAMLGAAMVVESWFPRHAMVDGDIDRAQALRAQRWVQETLGRPVPLPVRVDEPALLRRLAPRFSGYAQVEAFGRLYLGESPCKGTVAAVLNTVPPDDAERWFVGQFREYEAGTLGSLAQMLAWLDAGGDLARLCELACFDERGPRYAPVRFATTLADTWIGLPREATAFLDSFRKPSGEAPTAASLIGSATMDVGAIGRHLDVRLEPSAIEASLRRVFGGQAPEVVAAFGKRTAANEAGLEEPRAGFPAFAALAEELDDEDLPVLDSADHLTPRWRRGLEWEAFVALQGFEKLLSLDPRIGRTLENPKTCRDMLARSGAARCSPRAPGSASASSATFTSFTS